MNGKESRELIGRGTIKKEKKLLAYGVDPSEQRAESWGSWKRIPAYRNLSEVLSDRNEKGRKDKEYQDIGENHVLTLQQRKKKAFCTAGTQRTYFQGEIQRGPPKRGNAPQTFPQISCKLGQGEIKGGVLYIQPQEKEEGSHVFLGKRKRRGGDRRINSCFRTVRFFTRRKQDITASHEDESLKGGGTEGSVKKH